MLYRNEYVLYGYTIVLYRIDQVLFAMLYDGDTCLWSTFGYIGKEVREAIELKALEFARNKGVLE